MIRGTKKPLAEKRPIIKADLRASIHNRFDIEVVDAGSGKVKKTAQAENVICDALWTRLLNGSAYFSYIHYGTGNGSPSTSDKQLFSFLGYLSAGTATYIYDFDNGVVASRKLAQINESTAVGATLTEVGIAYSTGATSLVTHAMLKDMNGNPVSITKTDTDIINIYATVYVHYNPAGYDNGTVKILGSKYNDLLTKTLVGESTSSTKGQIIYFATTNGLVADVPAENKSTHAIGSVTTTYDAANKKIIYKAERFPVGSYNLAGGIGSVIFGSHAINISGGTSPNTYYFVRGCISAKVGGNWFVGSQVTGEPVATGDGVTTDFATKFAFVSNATIYVDGVASGNVVVDQNLPLSAEAMGKYFEIIPELSSDLAPTPEIRSNSYENTVGVYYNPFYEYGITSYKTDGSLTVSVSDDLNTWNVLSERKYGLTEVPAEYQNYKYWRLANPSRGSDAPYAMTSENIKATNIHFSVPPAEGAVITADYFTKTIAKDENHVFDMTVTIQLGEYTED
jgi:hypothetical protein